MLCACHILLHSDWLVHACVENSVEGRGQEYSFKMRLLLDLELHTSEINVG